MLQLRHVFLGRGFVRERPWQHELRFEHGIAALDPAIQSSPHPAQRRVADPLLDMCVQANRLLDFPNYGLISFLLLPRA